jgi:hypothetical protein
MVIDWDDTLFPTTWLSSASASWGGPTNAPGLVPVPVPVPAEQRAQQEEGEPEPEAGGTEALLSRTKMALSPSEAHELNRLEDAAIEFLVPSAPVPRTDAEPPACLMVTVSVAPGIVRGVRARGDSDQRQGGMGAGTSLAGLPGTHYTQAESLTGTRRVRAGEWHSIPASSSAGAAHTVYAPPQTVQWQPRVCLV